MVLRLLDAAAARVKVDDIMVISMQLYDYGCDSIVLSTQCANDASSLRFERRKDFISSDLLAINDQKFIHFE